MRAWLGRVLKVLLFLFLHNNNSSSSSSYLMRWLTLSSSRRRFWNQAGVCGRFFWIIIICMVPWGSNPFSCTVLWTVYLPLAWAAQPLPPECQVLQFLFLRNSSSLMRRLTLIQSSPVLEPSRWTWKVICMVPWAPIHFRFKLYQTLDLLQCHRYKTLQILEMIPKSDCYH